MSTKALSVVVAAVAALLMVDSAAAIDYPWWNDSWHYRVNVTVNTSTYNRTDWPIEYTINFTQYNMQGAFDNLSVRVVEYNTTTKEIISGDIPSQFDAADFYNKDTNAYGEVVWMLNGTRPPDTNLTYFIYFDSEVHGQKPAPNYPSTLEYYEYFYDGSWEFGLNNSKIGIRVDTAREHANQTSGMVFANISDTIIFDRAPDADPVEYIQYNNPLTAVGYDYDFKDSQKVIAQGPIRIKVRLNGSEENNVTQVPTGKGYMTKTYTIYKNSDYVTINQTFTATDDTVRRNAHEFKALYIDVKATNINPNELNFDGTQDEPSWSSFTKNNKGIGLINLYDSEDKYTVADKRATTRQMGVNLDTFIVDALETVTDITLVNFFNETFPLDEPHHPFEALRNRTKYPVETTLQVFEERRIQVQVVPEFNAYNRYEQVNITGTLTNDTHDLVNYSDAVLTDFNGANTTINLTRAGSTFSGNYTLPLNATVGTWNLTIRSYDKNDYLLNTSMTTFVVTSFYNVSIIFERNPVSANRTANTNVSVKTIESGAGVLGLVPGLGIYCEFYNISNPSQVKNVSENITQADNSGKYSNEWIAPEVGLFNFSCNVTKNNNTGNLTIPFESTEKDNTTVNISLATYTYNITGIKQDKNKTFLISFNATNLDDGYAEFVNISFFLPENWSVLNASDGSNHSCGGLSSYKTCGNGLVNIEVIVPETTLPGVYIITANATWKNINSTPATNTTSDWINVTVNQNPVTEIMEYSLNGTFSEDTSFFFANFTVNSTGNYIVPEINLTCWEGDVCNDFSPTIVPNKTTNLDASEYENISLYLTIPNGYQNGSKGGKINATYAIGNDTYNVTLLLNVTILESRNWTINESSCFKPALPNSTGDVCEVEINNTGNIHLNFSITPKYNSSSFTNYTYPSVPNFTVNANTSYKFRFIYNTTNGAPEKNATNFTINATDSLAEPAARNITITVDVVTGPDINFFNITPGVLAQLEKLTINVNVTDRLEAGSNIWVSANISWFNGTLIETVNLTNTTELTPGNSSNWSLNYTNTTLRGINFTVMVFSQDSAGGYGTYPQEANFTVYANMTLDITPDDNDLIYEPKSTIELDINITDSVGAFVEDANVTIKLIWDSDGQVKKTYPNVSTSATGGGTTEQYTLASTRLGNWHWTANVSYFDADANMIVTKDKTGNFYVDYEKTVVVNVDGVQYKGTSFKAVIYVDYDGDPIPVNNVTVNLEAPNASVIDTVNATRVGNTYEAIFKLAKDATNGTYTVKANAYEGAVPWKGYAFFGVPEAALLGLSLDINVENVYKPGDIVTITAFLSNQLGEFIDDAVVNLTITDSNQSATLLNMTPINSTTPPKYEAQYTIPDDAPLGAYTLFGNTTYDIEYESDVKLFVVTETLFTQIAVDPIVYLNESMNFTITAINPVTREGIDPDNMTLILYRSQDGDLTPWKNFTKNDFNRSGLGVYTNGTIIDNSTPTGSYIAILEFKKDSYRVWGMQTFKIQARSVLDLIIFEWVDKVPKNGNQKFKVNATLMAGFVPGEDLVVRYWIDEDYKRDQTPVKFEYRGHSVILDLEISSVDLPEGPHQLKVAVYTLDGELVAETTKFFDVTAPGKGGAPGGPAGGGGAPEEVPEGVPKISIIEFYPTEVHVERGGTNYLIATVENLGGAELHDITARIDGIPEDWFEVIKGDVALLGLNETSDFLIQINVPEGVAAQIITLTVTANATESSHQRSIIMRIFSSRDDLVYFEIESVKKTMRRSEDRALRALNDGKNVSEVMTKIDEARMEIRQAEDFLSAGEYENALRHLDNAREVLEHVNELMEFLRFEPAPVAPVATPAPGLGVSTPILMFMFFMIAALGGAVVYLTRDRISGVFGAMGTPAVRKPKPRRKMASPEVMAKADGLRSDIRSTERLLSTMKNQHDMGLISDSTYSELKKRNEQKIKDAKTKLKKVGA